MSDTNFELSDTDFEFWRYHGYVILKVLQDKEIEAALDNAYQYMPSWEEFAHRPERYESLLQNQVKGLGLYRQFPFSGEALNRISVHPNFVAFAQRALGTEDIMLCQSELIGKYAGAGGYDQELHVDFLNNTLVYPTPDASICDIPFITYYTDVTVDLGPTYVVPQEYTRNSSLFPVHRNSSQHPDLYQREVAVTVPAGSTLIYSMNTFHRGSAIRASTGFRCSHHVGFRRADQNWCGQMTFHRYGGDRNMDKFLMAASPRERELVGFPRPGHGYWNEVSLAGVQARYPQMDLGPYRSALREAGKGDGSRKSLGVTSEH